MKKKTKTTSETSLRVELAELLIKVLMELHQEGESPVSAGPKIRDTINAKRLGKKLDSLSKEDHPAAALTQYLGKNKKITTWLTEFLREHEGLKNLKALLRIELIN